MWGFYGFGLGIKCSTKLEKRVSVGQDDAITVDGSNCISLYETVCETCLILELNKLIIKNLGLWVFYIKVVSP